MDLKVGDKARFVGHTRIWNEGDVRITQCGIHGYIRAISLQDDHSSGLFWPGELEKIEEPTVEFKSGDKVRTAELELLSRPANQAQVSSAFPGDSAERKKIPVASGVVDYFPAALAEIAKVSYAGNQQHNPGEPLHWARAKSTDQDDTIMRHFIDRGKIDSDGLRHSAKLAWRALALLQLELEAEGAPVARGAK
jgi:hypothetical protein